MRSRRTTFSPVALVTSATAAARGCRLRFRYVDASGEITNRDADVLGLAFRDEHWLLAAFCHLRGGLRLFRLERIRSARGTRRLAGGHADMLFDPRSFSAEAWLCADGRRPVLATVCLAPGLAPAWSVLFPGAVSELLPDGARLCHLKVSSVRVLAVLVDSLDGLAELVRPQQAGAAPSASARPRRPRS